MIVWRGIRLYKGVYGQNTHYMCVCGQVCGLVCCQHMCAALCAAMCAARWCVLPCVRLDGDLGVLGVLGTFYEDLQGEWMILERIFEFYAWRSERSVQKWLSVVYIGGVCGREGCEAANTCVWPHTQVCGHTLHVLECLARFWFLHFELTLFNTPTLIISHLEHFIRL